MDIGPNDSAVDVSATGSDDVSHFNVTPNKTAEIPVPNVPPGTVLHVTVGKGNRLRIIIVEVVGTE